MYNEVVWVDDPSFRCPDCQGRTQVAPWWDDPPEDGGCVIGDRRRCLVCDWSEEY